MHRLVAPSPASAPAALDQDAAFLLRLLEDTHVWRERLIEEVVFGGGNHVRARSTYQLSFPPDLIREFVDPPSGLAHVLLPLTTREKRPLLELEMTSSAGTPVHLLSRASVAEVQCEYLIRLALNAPGGHELAPLLDDRLLYAICKFTPGLYREYERLHDTHAVLKYLADGLEETAVTLESVWDWLGIVRGIDRVLVASLGEEPAPLSSSEHPLLALPLVDPPLAGYDEVTSCLERYRDLLEAADAAGAGAFLNVLAEYGRRWEVIVHTKIPVDVPVTLSFAENRPINRRWNGWSRQRFASLDARSAHFEIRTSDPHLVIADFRAFDAHRHSIGIGVLESARLTPESLSLYSSVEERPYYVDVEVRLVPALQFRALSAVLAGLSLAAVIAAASLDEPAAGGKTEPILIAELALLAVPTTLAVTFALVREQSALASRLQLRWRLILLTAVVALWVTILIRIG